MREKTRSSALASAMILSVASVALIAMWDDARESAAALQGLAREQAMLAEMVARGISTEITSAQREASAIARDAPHPSDLATWTPHGDLSLRLGPVDEGDPTVASILCALGDGRSIAVRIPFSRLVRAATHIEEAAIVIVRPPGARTFRRIDGRPVDLDPTLNTRDRSVTLTRAEAASLGLPSRMAIAGLAHFKSGSGGTWSVAVIESAQRERDRERRAQWRLALCVLVATGLVAGFGGVALRLQRHDMDLQRALVVRDLERDRDAQLSEQERATMMITLAAGVAHEVATPLSVISGRAQQLATRLGDDDRSRRAVLAIVDQAARIHEVIRGFLRVARGDVANFQQLNGAVLVAATATLVAHRFANAEVTITTEVSEDLPSFRGDKALLEQVLVNLLLNACDACTPSGHVTLAAWADDPYVAFGVQDDGTGISEADAARVFEPFFSTKPSHQGTGLGLAIASEIVKIHRGSLTLEACHPRGTLARVRLPIDGDG